MTTYTYAQVEDAIEYLTRWTPIFIAAWLVALILAARSGEVVWWHAALGAFVWACYGKTLMVKGQPIPKRPGLRKYALKTLLPFGVLVGAAWALFSEDVARSVTVGALAWGIFGSTLMLLVLVPFARRAVKRGAIG